MKTILGTKAAVVVMVASLAFLAIAGVGSYLTYNASTKRNCETVNQTRHILSEVIHRGESLRLKLPHPGISTAEIHAFYRHDYRELMSKPC